MGAKEQGARRKRYGLLARILVFSAIVVGCGVSSRALRTQWTAVFPNTCAETSMDPPAVDTLSFPARVGAQENPCERVSDGHCKRSSGGAEMRGECRDGRMDGAFSVKDAASGVLRWSGEYDAGFPRGELRIRRFPGHDDVYPIEGLLLDGPSVVWERDGDRLIELAGRYEKGRHVGRFVRRVEGAGAVRSALVFDDQGLASKEFFYCLNGTLKERRGERFVYYDAEGHERQTTNPTDEPPCPLP